MKAKTTKTKAGKRNTGMFYAILATLPEYQEAMKVRKDKTALRQECKEIEITDFLKAKYGEGGCYSGSLTALSDEDYAELLASMEKRAIDMTSKEKMYDEQKRKHFFAQMFTALGEIGVNVHSGYYRESNRHIESLPIMRGRTLKNVPTEELPAVVSALRAYCDNIAKKQAKEAKIRAKEVELAKRN